jgi:hypothetical protein
MDRKQVKKNFKDPSQTKTSVVVLKCGDKNYWSDFFFFFFFFFFFCSGGALITFCSCLECAAVHALDGWRTLCHLDDKDLKDDPLGFKCSLKDKVWFIDADHSPLAFQLEKKVDSKLQTPEMKAVIESARSHFFSLFPFFLSLSHESANSG